MKNAHGGFFFGGEVLYYGGVQQVIEEQGQAFGGFQVVVVVLQAHHVGHGQLVGLRQYAVYAAVAIGFPAYRGYIIRIGRVYRVLIGRAYVGALGVLVGYILLVGYEGMPSAGAPAAVQHEPALIGAPYRVFALDTHGDIAGYRGEHEVLGGR